MPSQIAFRWTTKENDETKVVDENGSIVADFGRPEILLNRESARLAAQAPAMLDLLMRLRRAFYVEGNSKALRPVLSEAVDLIKALGLK